MRILVHDFSGHPFQVELSRQLAARGHEVLHAYCMDFLTPRGQVKASPGDPPTFAVAELSNGATFAKHGLLKRWQQERSYGRHLANLIGEFRPDAILSANAPLESQALALAAARKQQARFVYWVQDLYGKGIDTAVRRRLPLLGSLVGRYFIQLENRLLEQSDAVVFISEDFRDFVEEQAVRLPEAAVISNWAPKDELPVAPKRNSWSERAGLGDRFAFVYSGTLGFKHDSNLLTELAAEFRGDEDVVVYVVSEGSEADLLRETKTNKRLANLEVTGFQDYEELPNVLGSADVLLSILTSDAGVFSVPSKIYSYLCAGRPILAAVPGANASARTVRDAGAGLVVEPSDTQGFLAAARRLYESVSLREKLGVAGRSYAEEVFDIKRIGSRFEPLLAGSN